MSIFFKNKINFDGISIDLTPNSLIKNKISFNLKSLMNFNNYLFLTILEIMAEYLIRYYL